MLADQRCVQCLGRRASRRSRRGSGRCAPPSPNPTPWGTITAPARRHASRSDGRSPPCSDSAITSTNPTRPRSTSPRINRPFSSRNNATPKRGPAAPPTGPLVTG